MSRGAQCCLVPKAEEFVLGLRLVGRELAPVGRDDRFGGGGRDVGGVDHRAPGDGDRLRQVWKSMLRRAPVWPDEVQDVPAVDAHAAEEDACRAERDIVEVTE